MSSDRPPSRWSILYSQLSRTKYSARPPTRTPIAPNGGHREASTAAYSQTRIISPADYSHGDYDDNLLYNSGLDIGSAASDINNLPTTARSQIYQGSHSRLSSLAQLKERRNSMFVAKPREARRERTYVGAHCVACEEPLEHTLRGERILQLSCGHVSHEACFYEYIKEFEAQDCPECGAPLGLDTSRGGGIDFANLNKLVRAAKASDRGNGPRGPRAREEDEISHISPRGNAEVPTGNERAHLLPQETRLATLPEPQATTHDRPRAGSDDAATVRSNDYAETQHTGGRRYDYDVQSVGTAVSTRATATKSKIQPPKITIRSEFPTITKSREPQALTCLITVEVTDRVYQPATRSEHTAPPVPAVPERFQNFPRPPSRTVSNARTSSTVRARADSVGSDAAKLEQVKDNLRKRCENWHGLDFTRFGRLLLHSTMRVSKDRKSWQDLECYLFTEMLICVKPKKPHHGAHVKSDGPQEHPQSTKVALKGSILIKKHLNQVELIEDTEILTLGLSVPELPHFYLQFHDHSDLQIWQQKLININKVEPQPPQISQLPPVNEHTSESEAEEELLKSPTTKAASIAASSHAGAMSHTTAPTEYTASRIEGRDLPLSTSNVHAALDIVVVVPLSASMQGLKLNVLRDSLRFLVSNLGERDRLGLVTFGSGGSGVPLVGLTSKNWLGWSELLDNIRPSGQKNMRADVVDGANVAMDVLMQRKSPNPISSIFLISDSATIDHESAEFVVSRAEAAKVLVHSFGLGLTHSPDILVELSTKTRANYVYVKDWMMLRECMAGSLGALQSTSHQNVKLKIRLPEGCPAKFVKISGGLQVMKRTTGRDAEVLLGDIRFGDKRDILVSLAILPDMLTADAVPVDPWDSIVSGLEALGGSTDQDEIRAVSVEEVPLLQADLTWTDTSPEGQPAHLSRPSLLAITLLPASSKQTAHSPPTTPPIPPHPSIVQRRMELLTSDMLARAMTLVSRGQAQRAQHLLSETRSILKGLNKGSLPPVPSSAKTTEGPHASDRLPSEEVSDARREGARSPSPNKSDPPNPFSPTGGIDPVTVAALDAELESSMEWISHPAVFSRDSRKAVMQAIGVISSQRAYTFRTAAESLWASRVSGIKLLSERSRDWRETGEDALMEE